VTSELISGLLHLLDGLRAILVLMRRPAVKGRGPSDEDGELNCGACSVEWSDAAGGD